MKKTALLGTILATLALGGSASAVPPAHPPATTCTVAHAAGTFVATFDDSMTGSVTVDGAAGTRRFKVKSTPYAATYILLFQGYLPGDVKPATERLMAGKSIVARLVLVGDAMRLYFDSDYTPPGVRPSMDGLPCK